jgi:GTPase SAR1 family protein
MPNEYKIVIDGPNGAGKTSFLHRAKADTFNDSYKHTIGFDVRILSDTLKVFGDPNITKEAGDQLIVADVGDQVLMSEVYKDVKAVILMTDLTHWSNTHPQATAVEKEKLDKQIKDIRQRLVESRASFYIVGTKQDGDKGKDIQKAALANLTAWAEEQGVPIERIFITTSKEELKEVDETIQFKSPLTIFNIIYTGIMKHEHNLKSEQVRSRINPTESVREWSPSFHVPLTKSENPKNDPPSSNDDTKVVPESQPTAAMRPGT